MTSQALATQNAQGSLEEQLRASINSIALIKVTDAASFEQAAALKGRIVELEKKVVEYWSPIKKSSHETWKGIVAKESGMLDPLSQKKEAQRRDAKRWADEEETKRLAAEREAQEKARKQAEDDAIALAAELEASGDKAAAEEVIQAPVAVPQVVAPTTVPKGHGGLLTKYYSADLVGNTEAEKLASLKLLVAAVAAGKVPPHALQINQTYSNGQAKQFKSTEALAWPGVKVVVR